MYKNSEINEYNKNSNKNVIKTFVRRIIIYIIIGAVLITSILFYFDHFYLDPNRELVIITTVPVEIPQGATCVGFSHDYKYMSYIFDGDLYIKEIKTGQIANVIRENGDICYALELEDRNLIMYFVYEQKRFYYSPETPAKKYPKSMTPAPNLNPVYVPETALKADYVTIAIESTPIPSPQALPSHIFNKYR